MKYLKILYKNKIYFYLCISVAVVGGFYAIKKLTASTTSTQYVTAPVVKGTLVVSVSGTGQVASGNQIEVKPNASGEVVKVAVKSGQEVKKGDLLIQLNTSEAYKTVRDAQINLESAQLSLQKLKSPTDNLSLIQAQNALAQAQENKQQTIDGLTKSYEDGFNSVANAFVDLSEIMTGLKDTLYTGSNALGGTNQTNIDYYSSVTQNYNNKVLLYKEQTDAAYAKAKIAYDANLENYKLASRFSANAVIETLIKQTYETTKLIAETLKDANTLIQFYKDTLIGRNLKPANLSDTHLDIINGFISQSNSNLNSLLTITNTIQSDKQKIIDGERTISEKTESLNKLQSGANVLDIQSQELSVKQRQNALTDAYAKLADYNIKAPIDGVVAKVSLKTGDTASSGTSAATIIAKQQVSEISLNEVDVAKIKQSQKATLTLDAIENLEITGQVGEIDQIGVVSQGVVSYLVKIIFDTQDERIKPGMSITANIITDFKTDILIVPSSAIKSQNGDTGYVEVLNNGQPVRKNVQTGLNNDTETEIISGLNANEEVITQTINGSQTTTQQTQPRSGSNSIIPTGGGGATFRAITR